MEQTDPFEKSIYRVAISLVIFGLGLLSTLFVIAMILFIKEMGEGRASPSGYTADLVASLTRILPLTIALAAALIMLNKGLSLLLRMRELSESAQ